MIDNIRRHSFVKSAIILGLLLLIPINVPAGDGDLNEFTLPNGLKVIIKEDHAKSVASVQYWVMVGAADETESRRGISHLLEHMVFKGTDKLGVGEMAAEIKELGGVTNAFTSHDETVYFVSVPSDSILRGLEILTDVVTNPKIDPAELEKEKEVVVEEILETKDKPRRTSYRLLAKTAYTKSPYKFPVIGYEETVRALSRKDIIDFVKKWYVPENMRLVIAGDVDPAQLKPEIVRLLGHLKPVPLFRPPRPSEPTQDKIRTAVSSDKRTKETWLQLGFHIPSGKGIDANALHLAANILGAKGSSRLIRVLKKEKQLVNSIAAVAETPKESGIFVIRATLDAKNVEAATKAITSELKRIAEEPPTSEELSRARTNIESRMLFARETTGGMAFELGGFEVEMGDPSYGAKYLRLNSDVTEAEISQVIKKYLMPPNVTVAVLMPEKHASDLRMERLANIVKGLPARKSLSSTEASSNGILTRTLPNGMRVVLKPDQANPVVSVRITCLGGKRYESTDTQGIMNLIARMVDKGAGKWSELDIDKKFEDMGGFVSGFSNGDSFGVQASLFSRDLSDGLAILADIYSRPTFEESTLERERKLVLNQIKTATDRPYSFAFRRLNETLFPNHPYGYDRDGTPETVSRFGRDDLLETYSRFAVPSNTVITVVGKMDPKATIQRIAELFGKTPAKEVKAPEIAQETPVKKVTEKTIKVPAAKARVLIGFRSTTLKDEDRYALSVLNNVLSGMGGRLFVQLRDKQSLAYAVGSTFQPGVDTGSFAFYIACDPSKVDEAVAGMLKEIKLVRNAAVTENELRRAKTGLAGRRKLRSQRSKSMATEIASNTIYGLGHEYHTEYLKRISEVTAEQVLDAARKYLDPDRCVILKIMPEPQST
ncbi:M16 family metallopeptidase [Thermodesulfobacteriota bacterium]